MPPAVSRYGPQNLSNAPFGHLQQSHLAHYSSQHQAPGSAGLPPPLLNSQPGYAQGSSGSNINLFTTSGNANGLAGGFGTGVGIGGGGTGLASPAAIMGFQHGAAMQQQQQQREAVRRTSGGGAKNQMKGRIREVWAGNLHDELDLLRSLVDKYPYISMDTEFPGIVARPMGAFTTKADYHYQTLRCNVDLLKVIQLGITLFSEDGEMPPPHHTELIPRTAMYTNNLMPYPCTWQFNFQFSVTEDMSNNDSIEFLATAGLDLAEHQKNGIDAQVFGAVLITSGLVLLEDVRWISFHSGYDFGYLVKLMLCKPLPEDELEYRKLLSIFFPSIYDIKFMVKHAQRNQTVNDQPLTQQATTILQSLGQKSGLQDLADELAVKRVGIAHQAGSDSLLTGRVFWEVKAKIFGGSIDDEKYLGQVWGLNGAGSSLSTNFAGANNYAGIEEHNTPNLNGATIYNNSNTPSTPGTSYTAPAMTPSQNQGDGTGLGPMTPGNGGGAFGHFQFQQKR